jgi:MYXO-CTERM domain-containing protein
MRNIAMKKLLKLIASAAVAIILACGGFAAPAARATPMLTGTFAVDNYAFVYLSTSASTLGTLIASGTGWSPATTISPVSLLFGATYYLNIEVINADVGNQYSSGGFLGAFFLGTGTFANGSSQLLTGVSGWTGTYNDSNSSDVAQPWVAPSTAVYAEGANGISPWGSISGVSGVASWIWSSNGLSGDGATASGNQCGACTIDLQAVIHTAAPEPPSWTIMLAGLAGLGALRFRHARRQ